MGMHALWNGLLTVGGVMGNEDSMLIINLVLLPLEVLMVFFIFQLSLGAERRMLIRELTEEAERGLLPAAHIDPLCSYFGRNSTRFLANGGPEDAYIKTATTLAMRKHQVRRCPPNKREAYSHDVERLRRELAGILSLNDASDDLSPEALTDRPIG
jgi:hypothetical protein